MTEQQTPSSSGQIVATPATDYRLKRFALVIILLVFGVLSYKDGFYKYPQENEAAKEQKLAILPHPGFDVPMNKTLGILLPPLSLVFLGWTFYISRGSYRFDGTMLHIPGHPPIPMNALRKVDKARWDRKGIALVDYQFPGTSKGGRFKLDDFVYLREPTDQIFAVIESSLGPPIPQSQGSPVVTKDRSTGGVTPPAAIPAKPRPGTPPTR